MNTFSTEFPLKNGFSIDSILSIAGDWIAGSPYSEITKRDIVGLIEKGDGFYESELENFSIGRVVLGDHHIGGVRWVKREDGGLEWTSCLVTLKSLDMHLVNIQVACEALNTSVNLPFPRKPHVIKKLFEEVGGGKDGIVTVLNNPHYLTEYDVHYAMDLIMGEAGNVLPIVYISAGFDGSYMIDPAIIARELSGIAHVFVEPDRAFSYKMKKMTNSDNVYGGNVGVYWPDGNAKKVYYPKYFEQSELELRKVIVRDVSYAVSNRRTKSGCNWLYLRECIAKSKYEQLKQHGSKELDDYILAFDEETAIMKEQLLEAEVEIGRLKAELSACKSVCFEVDSGIVLFGKEQNFYRSEIKDIVLKVLRDSLRNLSSESRRYHVIDDIIKNNECVGEGDEMFAQIKRMFASGVDLDSRVKSQLIRMGFSIEEDGKHYKIFFQEEDRYMFSVSKTSSDYRAGKNLASIINKKLF